MIFHTYSSPLHKFSVCSTLVNFHHWTYNSIAYQLPRKGWLSFFVNFPFSSVWPYQEALTVCSIFLLKLSASETALLCYNNITRVASSPCRKFRKVGLSDQVVLTNFQPQFQKQLFAPETSCLCPNRRVDCTPWRKSGKSCLYLDQMTPTKISTLAWNSFLQKKTSWCNTRFRHP